MFASPEQAAGVSEKDGWTGGGASEGQQQSLPHWSPTQPDDYQGTRAIVWFNALHPPFWTGDRIYEQALLRHRIRNIALLFLSFKQRQTRRFYLCSPSQKLAIYSALQERVKKSLPFRLILCQIWMYGIHMSELGSANSTELAGQSGQTRGRTTAQTPVLVLPPLSRL